jgi:FtsZ-binding cell division protein ZapB
MTENNDSTNSRNEKRYCVRAGYWYNYTGIGRCEDENFTTNEVCDLINEQHEENEQLKHDATVLIQANQDYRRENEQLKQQMQRLYNYFADWFDDRVRPSDFSEMWDFVKEDEKWD